MTFTPIANSEFGEEINPGVEISQQDSQGMSEIIKYSILRQVEQQLGRLMLMVNYYRT